MWQSTPYMWENISFMRQKHPNYVTKYLIHVIKHIIYVTKYLVCVIKHLISVTKYLVYVTKHPHHVTKYITPKPCEKISLSWGKALQLFDKIPRSCDKAPHLCDRTPRSCDITTFTWPNTCLGQRKKRLIWQNNLMPRKNNLLAEERGWSETKQPMSLCWGEFCKAI